MRNLILLVMLLGTFAFAGCPGPVDGPIDSGVIPACPAGVEGSTGSNPLACGGSDTTCLSSPSGYTCRCECGKYWECDQVYVVCGPDGGI